tara:strand:- start:2526 stop:2717 length:192 start_codon:yes stop_codon:yes gene_type:complete
MKIQKTIIRWSFGVLALLLVNAVSGQPAPGDPPDIKQEARNKAAVEKLGDLKQAVLLYVKGMT